MTEEIDLPEKLQPPMANGELVFDEPWQGRLFGMAVALTEAGVIDWADMQAALIDEVAVWEQEHKPGASDAEPEYPYYELFSAALEKVLGGSNVVPQGELASRAEAFAARPHGHDHDHPHDH